MSDDDNDNFESADLGGALGAPSVDLFGLNEFGEPGGMRELWGGAIGAGLSTAAAIAARAFGGGGALTKYSELIGLGVGAAAGLTMIAMPATRAAGWTAVATAVTSNGFRFLEQLFLPASAPAQMGAVVTEQLNQFGAVVTEPMNQFGAVVTEPMQLAGPQISNGYPPVNMMHNSGLPASSQHVSVLGGPGMSGLAGHFGSTLFGGN